MREQTIYLIFGIILFITSLFLVINGILIDRLEFCFIGFSGAFGIGKCIRRVIVEIKPSTRRKARRQEKK